MTEQTEAVEDVQVVVFHLGSEEYGADISQIREIIRVGDITPIPQSPPDIDGVINLRGNVTMVVNLRKRLGMEERPIDGNSRIVVAEIGKSTIGIMVDNVTEVKYIQGNQIEPMSNVLAADQEHGFITGICKLKNRLLILVDLRKALGADQTGGLADAAVV